MSNKKNQSKMKEEDNITSVLSYKIRFSSSASMLKVRSGTSLISFCKEEKMSFDHPITNKHTKGILALSIPQASI